MRIRPWAVLLWLGAAASPAARADEPATPPADPPAAAPAPAPAPGQPATPLAAPAVVRRGWAALGGVGFYEVIHAGASYHLDERAAFEGLVGFGFTGNSHSTSLGLAFAHALGERIKTLEWGWDLKALYWTESDPNYDWKNMSIIAGGYLVKDLDARFSLKLDAGVAFSFALDSHRKQDDNFAHPTHWNPSLCLDLVYRFGR
ncbi:MAG: hypothetical protein QM767_23190 [Anaeromyxobacter sp.]